MTVKSKRPGASKFDLAPKQIHELYYFMKLTRRVEERLANLYKQGKIVGGLYGSRGQEAVSVGTAYALQKQDYLAPMIRNLGSMLVKGFTPRDLFCQYMARATGPSKGKDCNLHFGDVHGRRVVSCISHLGALIPVMAGVALAGKLRRQNHVALTYIGDGGMSVGDFHEGVNMAAVLDVPFVLVVENNQWAYSTPADRQTKLKDLYTRADAYGVKGSVGDGNNVLEVYRVAKAAIEDARAGGGPQIVEFKTMRMKGHAEHDPAEYVPREVLDAWKKRDPIDHIEGHLRSNDLMTEAEMEKIHRRIEDEIADAETFAEQSPLPDPADHLKGVYADDSIVSYEAWWERP